MYLYEGVFSEIPVTLGFQYLETAGFYGSWIKKTSCSEHVVTVPPERIEEWRSMWKATNDAYSEYAISCSYVCDYLMQFNRIVFHGACFLWNGKAYIFTAPSGTGKTTQLKLWKSLFSDEITVLNGDKPILEFSDQILVHPSPWKGKEGMGRDDITVPLGGIITLRQDKQNTVERMPEASAARYLFGRFYTTFPTDKHVICAAGFIEKMIKEIPVLMLRNLGDTDSVLLTRKYIETEINQ